MGSAIGSSKPPVSQVLKKGDSPKLSEPAI
jgi:hypothetical protein